MYFKCTSKCTSMVRQMSKSDTGKVKRTSYQDVISLARRRGILYPSYEIYGGVAGFYDWGPVGTLIKNNFLKIWREAYLEGEGFYEIDCPNITPENVFRASGHLAEFTDFMTRCLACGLHYRADHLLAELHPNPDILGKDELGGLLRSNDVRCPECKGELGEPYSFNLMFATQIGPTSDRPGYLRPETAQGMFLNFKNLFLHNRQKLPLGVIQIGKGFRNEISPRQGVIRVREFNMAELELFVDPHDNDYENYPKLKETVLRLLPDSDHKETVVRTLQESVDEGIVSGRILAYFMALTQQILTRAGLDFERLRFRQHEKHEMAHYARDCWDAEALTDFGWIEIVGIADRSCYDVEQHMKHSGVDLRAARQLAEPKLVKVKCLEPNMSKLGPAFKKDAGKIAKHLMEMDAEMIDQVVPDSAFTITIGSDEYEIIPEMYAVIDEEKKISVEKFIPNVIEPSYGVDRILYCVLEHSLECSLNDKNEETRVMHLPSGMAPYQYAVFPLMTRDGLDVLAKEIFERLKKELRGRGYMGYYDESGSIGRRYSRMDEIGAPYCITVDHCSLEDGTLTIRERDSRGQLRLSVEQLDDALTELIENGISLKEWAGKHNIDLLE